MKQTNSQQKILIFIGKGGNGKSLLTKCIMEMIQMADDEDALFEPTIYTGTEKLKIKSDDIKQNCSSGFYTIIHLQTIEDIKKVPLGLRRRTLIFEINKVII